MNALADLVEETVERAKDGGDFESLNLECLRLFGIQPQGTSQDFENTKAAVLSDQLLEEVVQELFNRQKAMKQTVMNHLSNWLAQPERLQETVGIPVTFAGRSVQLGVKLQSLRDTDGQALITELEKALTLFLTDEAWKNHLRDMDDLKQSVQNAVYEQKDPLVIYKMESFGMFKKMLSEIYQDLLSMLFQARIQGTEEAVIAGAAPARRSSVTGGGPSPALTATKAEYGPRTAAPAGPSAPAAQPAPPPPLRVGPKIGRNDPCPCGSGRKFKACHGKDASE